MSNSRLQELTHDHPADITQMLQGLVTRRVLAQKGRTRGTYYMLPDHGTISPANDTEPSVAGDSRGAGDTQQLSGDVTGTRGDSQHPPGDSQHLPGDFQHPPGDSQHCYLRPMLEAKLLQMKFPSEPNRPDQAYTTHERATEL